MNLVSYRVLILLRSRRGRGRLRDCRAYLEKWSDQSSLVWPEVCIVCLLLVGGLTDGVLRRQGPWAWASSVLSSVHI